MSPYWIYRNTKNTIYAVTNRRCLIILAGKTKKVESYSKDRIGDIQKVQYLNGYGNVIFAKEYYSTRNSEGRRRIRENEIGFFNISDVDKVERLIRILTIED